MSIFKDLGLGGMLGAVVSPFTSIFSNIKNILILLVIAATVGGIWYLAHNYNKAVRDSRDIAITTATNVAADNAVDTKTVKESGKIAEEAITGNVEAKQEVVKTEKVITKKKKEKIVVINDTFNSDVKKPGVTEEEKKVLEEKRVQEIAKVQINALWDSYCEAVGDLEKSTLDQKLSCTL